MTNTPITVRTVFVGQHSIIVEDTTTVFAGGPTLAGQMDNYYEQLGAEFEATMYPLELANFGNPFVMDAQLGNLGKIVMVFSPRVNASSEGNILGFVVNCDFRPVSTAPSSNFGEYLYGAVPTSTALGYFDPGTRDSWLRQIRPTVMHEVKHIIAFGNRIKNGLPLEDLSWEEGMARTAEELYARTFYGTQSKQNTTWAASMGCDIKFATPGTNCSNRPLLMLRHFDALYTYFGAPEIVSMLGRTYAQDFTFYASAWAVERWANDIFGTSESQFLKDWTLSSVTGVLNLEQRTGQPWEQSLGEWSLAMYVGRSPRIHAGEPASDIPVVEYSGRLSRDVHGSRPVRKSREPDPDSISTATPQHAHRVTFGNFNVNITTLEGGAYSIFDLSGLQCSKQLIELRSVNGTDPPSTIRVAIVRIQ